MVKGVARQVIVVRQPDRRLFEQAIFIVKEDALEGGVTAQQVLSEAERVAKGYVKRGKAESKSALCWGVLGVILGAVLASILWAVFLFG